MFAKPGMDTKITLPSTQEEGTIFKFHFLPYYTITTYIPENNNLKLFNTK